VAGLGERVDMMEGNIHDLKDHIKQMLESTDFEQCIQDLVQESVHQEMCSEAVVSGITQVVQNARQGMTAGGIPGDWSALPFKLGELEEKVTIMQKEMQTEAVKIGSQVFCLEANMQVFLESMNVVSGVFAFIDIISFLEVGMVEPSLTNEFITRAYQLDKIDMSIPYNATVTNSFSLPLPGMFGKPNLVID
jgi:hypothetical protein